MLFSGIFIAYAPIYSFFKFFVLAKFILKFLVLSRSFQMHTYVYLDLAETNSTKGSIFLD